jgi:integrase
MSDIMIMKNESVNFRYGQKKCCVVHSDGSVVWYNIITLTDLRTMESCISEFTDFFFHKDYKNLSCSTKYNSYGYVITSFLNYVFIDKENPITNIEDIDIEMGDAYLTAYGRGELKDLRTSDGKTIRNTDETVKQAGSKLTHFYHWLYYVEDKGKRERKYRLRKIKKNDFKLIALRSKYRFKKSGEEAIVLTNMFNPEYPRKRSETKKINRPTMLMVFTLIDIARQYDPMLAFPIALESFTGIRRGETCQMTRGRFQWGRPLGVVSSLYIDLKEEKLLRDDGVATGMIKNSHDQLCYPGFLQYLDFLYGHHKAYLKQRDLDKDIYNALIYSDEGKAMTTKEYARRYNNLIPKLIERLAIMSKNGNDSATTDIQLLSEQKLTPHVLRYFFSQYLADTGENPYMIAVYRGDNNLDSVMPYIRHSKGSAAKVEEIQNSFAERYQKLMGEPLNSILF